MLYMPLIRYSTTDAHHLLSFVESMQGRRNLLTRAHITHVSHTVSFFYFFSLDRG